MTVISPPHIIPLVRKLRDAGVPQAAAEALGETMEQVVTREEMQEFATKADLKAATNELEIKMKELEAKMKLAISQSAKQMMVWTVAVQGLGVAILVLILK